jgi:hypothetical protein
MEEENTSNNRLQHPFDLALPAPELEETESPALNSELLEAAITTFARNRQRQSDAEFFTQTCNSRQVSYLKDLYQNDDRRAAIDLLSRRQKVDWMNSPYNISIQDPMLVWNIAHHHIDMIVCVSRDIGLSIILPNVRDHTFTFSFNFTERYRQFSAKFAKLGFDAKSSFLWVGKLPSHDDVFIAWAPIDSLTGDEDEIEVGLCTGNTTLSDTHYRITLMFFAFVMSDLGERGVWISEEYPSLDDMDEILSATNIL